MNKISEKKRLIGMVVLWLITAFLLIFGLVNINKTVPIGTKYKYSSITITFKTGNKFVMEYNDDKDEASLSGTYYVRDDKIEFYYAGNESDIGYIKEDGIQIGYNFFKNQGSMVNVGVFILSAFTAIFAIIFTLAYIKPNLNYDDSENILEERETINLKKDTKTANDEYHELNEDKQRIIDLQNQIINLQKQINDINNDNIKKDLE